jgi:hypothetical protein
MSPTRNSIAAGAEVARQRSRASSTSVGDRSIATTCAPRRAASTPARRCRSRHRAARAAHRLRQPAQQRRAHLVAAGAHGGADAADRRVRGQRAQASTAVRSK